MASLTTTRRNNLTRQSKRQTRFPSRLFATLVIFGLFVLSPAASASDTEPKTAYRLGVFPYLPALTIDRLYGPMAEAFSLELDRLVKLRTKSTFESFADAIADQSYDILFVHPFFLVDAIDQHDYEPLVRLDRPLKATLVATDGNATMGIEDLVGTTIGLPPKLAAVSHLIKSALIDAGIRPGLDIGTRHYRNKASCVQAVHAGAIAACGLPAFVLSEVGSLSEHPLQVVFEAPPVNHFAFAVHSRVPEQERRQLKKLLLNWDQRDDAEQGDVDAHLGGSDTQRFAPIAADDYATIRDKKTRLQTLAQR